MEKQQVRADELGETLTYIEHPDTGEVMRVLSVSLCVSPERVLSNRTEPLRELTHVLIRFIRGADMIVPRDYVVTWHKLTTPEEVPHEQD